MALSVEPITDETFQTIASMLAEWGASHPSPDLPILMTLDGSELTPRDISEAMHNWELPAAQIVRTLFSAALHFEQTEAIPGEAELLEDMLAVFQREIDQFRPRELTR